MPKTKKSVPSGRTAKGRSQKTLRLRILTTPEGIRYVPDADMKGSDRPKLNLRKLYPANPEVFGLRRRTPPVHFMHPGEYIELQYLEPLDMSPEELARRIKAPAILKVLRQKDGITADLALRLAKLFRTSAEYWMNVQTHYELRVAAAKVRLGGIRPVKWPD